MLPSAALQALVALPWNPLRDYPRVRCPHRASIKARAEWANEHGVLMRATVYVNRTRNHFWLEILCVSAEFCGSTLHLYQSTTSATRASEWTAAMQPEARP